MESWVRDIAFERIGPVRKALKVGLVDPLINFLPSSFLRGILKVTRSQLAEANWADPGGWRSMVLNYDGSLTQIADKVMVNLSTMSMALRNRRRLAGRLLARLIDEAPRQRAHVVCLGAGPGRIINDALLAARKKQAHATLVDLSADAFAYGQELAASNGLTDRMRWIQGDVRDIEGWLSDPPDVVKMLGICEYLSDRQIVEIAGALATIMPPSAPIVFNSLSKAHGNDRFFRRVLGLHMNHRNAKQLQSLMSLAGFAGFSVHPEPTGVYNVIVARKAT